MRCRKCGTDNALLKKTCTKCHAFLEGRAINNVTGQIGTSPKSYGTVSAFLVFMDLVNEHRVILWIGAFVAGLACAHFFGGPWG